MFRISCNGAQKHLFSCLYSTVAAAAAAPANVLAEFLVNSLDFSTKEAISTSAKLSRTKHRHYDPHLLFDLLDEMGMNKSQIKTLVSSSPQLLFCRVDENLKPKIKVLQGLGLSVPQLATFMRRSNFLTRGLDTIIQPNLVYLRDLLPTHHHVAMILIKEPRLFSYNLPKVMPPNISLLQNFGFTTPHILKAFHRHPRFLLNRPEWFERAVHRLVNDFHMPLTSGMFLHGVEVLVLLDESKLERKLDIFRSFGWSDSDICLMVQKLPYCLASSEAKIKTTLKFFMNELGYEPNYLASRAPLLKFSMEKRIVPRNEILKFLKENQLLKGRLCLYTAVSFSESDFQKKCVLPFREKMPEMYDLYMKSRS
ncbi:transcription termination factor MTERF9, chloroplastic [Solanum lycopersicum]|uniref:transcription termination factor MTERF9, chloroplastic n=1 Tax=Solanum lycopersicum TaxID=4081 RepID=UPI0002BCC509|nr:uncharacterized protein LOC101258025 [Solanum lycopersicum]XP_010312881.1 uncharacterized protein LOC101258025 [Solanum lycopersicum]XP_010312882.1 uncharacterized protein LOC101258025 [Solanum lycopersicum]